jgi:hypothetical protein
MRQYFEKARELGGLILESDEAKALAEANLKNENRLEAENNYSNLVNQVINMIKATVYEDWDAGGSHCGGCQRVK